MLMEIIKYYIIKWQRLTIKAINISQIYKKTKSHQITSTDLLIAIVVVRLVYPTNRQQNVWSK